MRFFDSFERDQWNEQYERKYLHQLPLCAPKTENLSDGTKYLNLTNGLYDLDKMALVKHDKGIFSTVHIPIAYNRNAECPIFMHFLDDIFEGDKELIKLVQEIMGYCLCQSSQAQKFFIFLGGGANGKSLLCNVIASMVGKDNVSSVSLRQLSGQFDTSDMVGKLVNISTENEMNGMKVDTEILKAISAGDKINVQRKYKDAFTTTITAKLIFAVNQLPNSQDTTEAFFRRLIIVPFNRTYVEEHANEYLGKIDTTLEPRILKEREGILNFALQGYERLKASGFYFTKASKSLDILDEYQQALNPIQMFVDECIEEFSRPLEKNSNRIALDELYECYGCTTVQL